MGDISDASAKRKRPAPRELLIEDLKPHFEQPLRQAARELNVSINYLKRACRKAGIKRWPYKKLRGVRTALAGLLQQAKSGKDSRTIETIIASLREEEALLLQGITADTAQEDGNEEDEDEEEDPQEDEDSKSIESSKLPRSSPQQPQIQSAQQHALQMQLQQHYAQQAQREQQRQPLDPLLAYHPVQWRHSPSLMLGGIPRPPATQSFATTPPMLDSLQFHRTAAVAAPPGPEYISLLQLVHEMQQSLGALAHRVQQLEEYLYEQARDRAHAQAHGHAHLSKQSRSNDNT